MSRRRLWMAPNTYSLLKDLPPFFVEAPNAQWVDILSEVELTFSCFIMIFFPIIHTGKVRKLNEYIVKKIKNYQVLTFCHTNYFAMFQTMDYCFLKAKACVKIVYSQILTRLTLETDMMREHDF